MSSPMNYFQSVERDENEAFIAKWKKFIGDDKRVTNDPMEATFIGFNMWVAAVEKAGTTDVDAVEKAMIGITTPNLTGGVATMAYLKRALKIARKHNGFPIAGNVNEIGAKRVGKFRRPQPAAVRRKLAHITV